MAELFTSNEYFALLLTLGTFGIGFTLQKRYQSPVFNPILVGAVLSGGFLVLNGISVETYRSGCAPLQYLLTPATICYAIGLYEQIAALRKQLWAILMGVAAGVVASMGSILLLCRVFGLECVLELSLLPKSITTAIGMELSQEAGGIAAVTTAAIILTGILGNMIGPMLCRLLRIEEPIAQGVAFGTASHAIGTSRAIKISQLTGAASSIALTLAGLITVVLYSFLV